MSEVCKLLAAVGACLMMSLAMGEDTAKPIDVHEGREWLAWSPAERNVYIHGYIEGWWSASHNACRLADDLFEVGKPHRLGHDPTARCQAQMENYTKITMVDSGPDFTKYSSVLTEFYSKHAEYQNIPKVYILSHLTDRNYKTADQLYQMAVKGQMRTHF